MRNIRNSSWLAAAALMAGVIGGCADDRSLTSPEAASQAVVAGAPRTTAPLAVRRGAVTANGLLREQALAADITVAKVIGPAGGTLSIPAAGFELAVPAGAVDSATSFSVTALAGYAIAYDFGPDGAHFPIALSATQDLRNTNVQRLPKGAVLSIGYFGSPSDVDGTSGIASVSLELSATVHPSGRSVSFEIPHFSGWLIHWRTGETTDSTSTP